ncbi:Gfo/Idh/MocA family protein [Thalassoroseus pseudoceratinae]|uniref:Gfo/Idh/MocA family protein n=1 Tax=Thalassoroseus pseudoceratinae TaxID=2713176 RepID=UPI00141E7A0A|nr:Gfo/Idh/MocA family oxidoreductase [Thalassoroseus pseudoceratinae]
MSDTPRRTFLKQAGLATAVWTGVSSSARAADSERLRVGMIGPGGMGSYHLRVLTANPEVEVAWVCDVDEQRLAKAVEHVESATEQRPQTTDDMRKVFDDDSIDAVFIATPDHWHAPAAILALDAGKHVYVEKPCSHNIREGRLMIEAAKRSGKFLQVGTQSRSTETVRQGVEKVLNGEIGDVLVTKAWNSQRRRNIGKRTPTDAPSHLNFDAWTGPAPKIPYQTNMLPSVWRWWRNFGCGDIGNDGVHDIDVALWGFGVNTHPSRVTCLGGKYFFDDDQEFPDTQYAVFEYPQAGEPKGRQKQFIFEQRIWSPYPQEGYGNGCAWYGTKGMLVMGHTRGWRLYGERGKLLDQQTGGVDLPAHHQNFFDCVRGKSSKLNAGIEVGHQAATLVHLANIAARVGAVLEFDPKTEEITNHSEANSFVKRAYRDHWATPKDA